MSRIWNQFLNRPTCCALPRFFNAPPELYSVVFTSGATAALKLVGDSFTYFSASVDNGGCNVAREPLTPPTPLPQPTPPDTEAHVVPPCSCTSPLFAYLLENHTSVVGLRELALARGVPVLCFRDVDLMSHPRPPNPPAPTSHTSTTPLSSPSLPVSGSSNFSGSFLSPGSFTATAAVLHSTSGVRLRPDLQFTPTGHVDVQAASRVLPAGQGSVSAGLDWPGCCSGVSSRARGLLAFPAQCNYTGRRYPLAWVEAVRSGRLAPQVRESYVC